MDDGKKGVAEKIFCGAAMGQVQAKKPRSDGLKIFEKAIENASPSVEVKSRRVGGATYQVPIEVPRGKKIPYLAAQWIIGWHANNRSGRPMAEKLSH